MYFYLYGKNAGSFKHAVGITCLCLYCVIWLCGNNRVMRFSVCSFVVTHFFIAVILTDFDMTFLNGCVAKAEVY